MAMQYINFLKNKANRSPASKEKPVLSEEDERFLNRITSQDEDSFSQLPVAGESTPRDAQIALMDGANNIPLPDTPQEEAPPTIPVTQTKTEAAKEPKVRKAWSWVRSHSRDGPLKKQDKEVAAASLMDAAGKAKTAEAQPNEEGLVEDVEAKKEEEDMAMALERLNLAAVNNRVFSVSDETQELLQKFTTIVKDLINGVPTAYNDLEKLLTNSDRQLQSTFQSLPSFLQKLIVSLPSKMTAGLAPEMMAAASEKEKKSGFGMEKAGMAAAAASKVFKTPNLKELVGKPGTIAAALRSIFQFLRARFPAIMGMNVVWSLAMFVLLFVFWYCHKRGREIRLDKERDLTEEEVARLNSEWRTLHPGEHPTTTAAAGASMEDVQAGMAEVEAARVAQEVDRAGASGKPSTLGTTVQPAEKPIGR